MSDLLSSHQFTRTQRSRTSSRPSRSVKTVADAVFDQLTEDYPKSAVEWVHGIRWKGPMEVPLSDIDFDNEKSWRASHELDKVNLFRRRIKAAQKKGEHIKATVLIYRPKKSVKNPVMVMDGHHRAEAEQQENVPVYGFVGYPSRNKGPWDTTHDKQFREGSGPQRQGNKGENIYR